VPRIGYEIGSLGMKHDATGPRLVLSPHLDDAVLSAWGVLIAPGEVLVANVCTALPPAGTLAEWDRLLGASDSAAQMQLRLDEDREALASLGHVPLNLPFLDAQYRHRALDAAGVLASLREQVTSVSALYCPAGIGGHPDHVATRELGLRAAAEAGIPVFLYAELPYATRFGWPPEVTGEVPLPTLRPEVRWRADLADASCGIGALVLRVTRLSQRDADRKLRAMEAYRTQFAALNRGTLDVLRNPEVRRFEVLWEVRGP
jgi:LmbE family N-acetylglucosaminyl deacetylase